MFGDIRDNSGQVPYLRYGPIKIAAVAGSAVCALLLCLFVWNIHPYSFGIWRADQAALWAAFFFAPILSLLWSVIAVSGWQPATYIWARRLIQLHAVSAVFIVLVGCTDLRRIWDLPPSWNLYGLLAFGSVSVDLIVLALAPWSNSDREDIGAYRRAQLKIAGGATAAIVIWSFVNIGLVVGQAQFIAGGKRYCLQVAGDYLGRYKPVRSLLDLNGLKMHTPFTNAGGSGDFQFAFHALLAVEDGPRLEWRHWSYWQQRFVPFKSSSSWLGKTGQSCEPRINFVLQLPLW
jgi:hypothetical protein